MFALLLSWYAITAQIDPHKGERKMRIANTASGPLWIPSSVRANTPGHVAPASEPVRGIAFGLVFSLVIWIMVALALAVILL
jgi:hypothetical protein